MRSKACFLAVVAMGLLVSSAFGQAQSSISLSGPGSASSSSTSTSSTSQGASQTATGMQTSTSGPASTPQQPAAVTLPSTTITLQPFSTVALCAPINLLIAPNSTANGYAFTVSAEQGVVPNIKAEVGPSGVLAITASGPFTTNQTVQLTASLPPDALNAILHSGPSASMYVRGGFNVASLNITTGLGAGELFVDNLTAGKVNISHHGIGALVIRGNLTAVTATSDAIAPLYISGVQTSAGLNLSSTADAFIEQAATSRITGTAAGLNRVFFTAGTCQMTNPFSTLSNLAFSTCTQQVFVNVPPAQPTWTCGIQLQGNFTCRPGTVLALGPSGSAVSQAGTPTLTSTTPGGFFSQGATPQGGSQIQAGTAQPGAASALAGIAGSVSSSAVATSGPGGSTSTTQTSQNGISQGFSTSSGGQTQSFGTGSPGVLVAYSGPTPETATAANVACAAPLEATRIPTA